MALRLVEMVLPEEDKEVIRDLLKDYPLEGFWQERRSQNGILVKLMLPAEKAEVILDALEKRFAGKEGFRIVLLPVEASIPRIDSDDGTPTAQEMPDSAQEGDPSTFNRISREELYNDIQDLNKLSKGFVVMVILSTLVAALGIVRDNVAIVIGAMVIAPLLGPNMALSLATTLGDTALGQRALKTGVTGTLIAIGVSVVIGAVLTVDPNTSEISSRTEVGLGDIVLALAAGTAGALAFTTGMSAALIGVMVAVALLPPLVTAGLLVGAGEESLAVGAILLFCTNMICINLAGVSTFLAQGVRPLTWWEAAQAKKATYRAIVLWVLLLAALVAVIVFSQGRTL